MPEPLIRDALAELARLAHEATDRFNERQYLEAMASLTALEPVKSLLVEQCSSRWASTAVPDDTDDVGDALTYGYV